MLSSRAIPPLYYSKFKLKKNTKSTRNCNPAPSSHYSTFFLPNNFPLPNPHLSPPLRLLLFIISSHKATFFFPINSLPLYFPPMNFPRSNQHNDTIILLTTMSSQSTIQLIIQRQLAMKMDIPTKAISVSFTISNPGLSGI